MADLDQQEIEKLLARLASTDAATREGAARQLGQLGSIDQTVIDALTAATNDNNPFVRDAARNALEVLVALGRTPPPVNLIVLPATNNLNSNSPDHNKRYLARGLLLLSAFDIALVAGLLFGKTWVDSMFQPSNCGYISTSPCLNYNTYAISVYILGPVLINLLALAIISLNAQIFGLGGKKYLEFTIGFVGWYFINGVIGILGFGTMIFELFRLLAFVFTIPINVVAMIVMAIVRRQIAFGMLAAFALNEVIVLVIGLFLNAICVTPFFLPLMR